MLTVAEDTVSGPHPVLTPGAAMPVITSGPHAVEVLWPHPPACVATGVPTDLGLVCVPVLLLTIIIESSVQSVQVPVLLLLLIRFIASVPVLLLLLEVMLAEVLLEALEVLVVVVPVLRRSVSCPLYSSNRDLRRER